MAYLKFPLAVLGSERTPAECMRAAVNCAMYSAGIGQRKSNPEHFEHLLAELAENQNLGISSEDEGLAEVLVGSHLCNVKIYNLSKAEFGRRYKQARRFAQGAFVMIDSDKFWRAFYQAMRDAGLPTSGEGGISWREFRVICAVYSIKPNSKGFVFISTEAIRARANGFLSPKEMRQRGQVAEALRPPLTTKQVRATLDRLESLRFFARVLYSSGTRGGRMAYSIRCTDRNELLQTVKDWVGFRGNKAKENRDDDRAFWAENGRQTLEE